MQELLTRAGILFQQGRYKEALKEYSQLLALDPDSGHIYGMMALCLLREDKYAEAEELIAKAISLEPVNPFLHYNAAIIQLQQDRLDPAETYIQEAIRLDPNDADFFAVLSGIHLSRRDWQKCLDAANHGLGLDPENVICLNRRATALIKLDKKEESFSTIKEALYFDPENSHTHANMGWGLLEKSEHEKALHHFKEALRFDPQNDHARSGMVEALKARYLFYRLFLKYAFWMGNMKNQAQWGVIIGFYIGSRVLRGVASAVPALRPVIIPLIVLYSLFALSTWIITPLSNLFLRLNRFGRYALDEEEITCSNYIGISLLIAAISGLLYLVIPTPALLILAVLGLSITVPVSGTFAAARQSKGRRILKFYTSAMIVAGLLSMIWSFESGNPINLFGIVYIIGFILFQWIGNALIMKR